MKTFCVGFVTLLLALSSFGMVHFGQLSTDPVITSAPTGIYANSGWQWQGDWGNGNGTIVSPTQILTVAHYGASTFTFNGNSYGEISSVSSGDMKLVTLDTSVHGDFSSWAPIYRDSLEVGKEFVVFGQGRDRGTQVTLSGDSKGWLWGASGTRRWGTNVFDSTAASGSQLVADFDSTGGTTYEAHLATWDSGGGVFIGVGGVWYLTGVNYAVDAFFNTINDDAGRFNAALYDMGGYYLGSDSNGWIFNPDVPVDLPSSMYMHRVSDYEPWLDANIVIPEPKHFAAFFALSILIFSVARRRSSRGHGIGQLN